MTKQQLRLHGAKKKRTKADDKRIAVFLQGHSTLRDTIQVTQDHLAELRAQAHAFYHSAKWPQCIQIVRTLAALEDLEPFDAVIAARAYTELGDSENAAAWAAVADRMLSDL